MKEEILHFADAQLYGFKQLIQYEGKPSFIAPVILKGDKPSNYFYAYKVPDKDYWKLFDIRLVKGVTLPDEFPDKIEAAHSYGIKLIVSSSEEGLILKPIVESEIATNQDFEMDQVNDLWYRDVHSGHQVRCEVEGLKEARLGPNLNLWFIRNRMQIETDAGFNVLEKDGKLRLSHYVIKGWRLKDAFDLDLTGLKGETLQDLIDFMEAYYLKVLISFEAFKEEIYPFLNPPNE